MFSQPIQRSSCGLQVSIRQYGIKFSIQLVTGRDLNYASIEVRYVRVCLSTALFNSFRCCYGTKESEGVGILRDGKCDFFGVIITRTTQLIKLPLKILHQFIALSINSKILKGVSIRKVSEAWPEGNDLGIPNNIRYRGLVLARVSAPAERVLVLNDLRANFDRPLSQDKYIPLKESKRLRLARLMFREGKIATEFDSETQAYIKSWSVSFARLDYLSRSKKHKKGALNCYVLVRFSGDVLIVDGTHRALAHYLINDNLEGLQMFVTS